MNPAYFFIGFFLLGVTGGFTYVGWTGRITYGTRTLVDRRTDRLGFWVICILYIVLFMLTQFFTMVDQMAAAKAMRGATVP